MFPHLAALADCVENLEKGAGALLDLQKVVFCTRNGIEEWMKAVLRSGPKIA